MQGSCLEFRTANNEQFWYPTTKTIQEIKRYIYADQLELIGRGSFAFVYRIGGGKYHGAVLKLSCLQKDPTDREALERFIHEFEKEVTILSKMAKSRFVISMIPHSCFMIKQFSSHFQIQRVSFSYGKQNNSRYKKIKDRSSQIVVLGFLMPEYSNLGRILSNELRNTTLRERQLLAVRVGRSIVAGLYDCKRMLNPSFVHCDLKPENIFLIDHSNGRESISWKKRVYQIEFRLADFNLSHIATFPEMRVPESSKSDLLASYVDPSLGVFGDADVAVDLWSLANNMYAIIYADPQTGTLGQPYYASLIDKNWRRLKVDPSGKNVDNELKPYLEDGSPQIIRTRYEIGEWIDYALDRFIEGLLWYHRHNRSVWDQASYKKYPLKKRPASDQFGENALGKCDRTLRIIEKWLKQMVN